MRACSHLALCLRPTDALGLANGTALDAPMGDIITITSSGCPDKCKSSSK